MHVVKRDGRREEVAFEKVQERITKAAAGLTVNPTKVAQGVLTRIVDGITTTELDNITASLAYSWSTIHPDYADLASQIAISNHQKNTPATMLELVNILDAVCDKNGEAASLLDPTFVALVRAHADEIESHLHYERDFLLDYFGLKTLERAYLLRDTNRRVVERPQHLWMRVALGLWGSDLKRAFETYDLMSQKFYTHATPTLFNSGTKRPQLSSCFVAGTPVHTMNGVKSIEDVEIGDEVVTHTGNIKKVVQLHRNPLGERKIYEIKPAGTPRIQVTENHRLMSLSDEQDKWGIKPTWNTVDYLRVGDWIAVPKKNDITNNEHYVFDVKTILDTISGDGNKISYRFEYNEDTVTPYSCWTRRMPNGNEYPSEKVGSSFKRYWVFDEEMMEFMGIWYGDGCVSHGKNSRREMVPHSINIVSHNTNEVLIDFVTKIMYEKFGIRHVSVHRDGHNMVSMAINNLYIAHIFKSIFKCKFDGKRLPSFFNRLSYECIKSFLSGLVSSDGCLSRQGNITLQLTNPPLVQDIFHLARSVGIPVTLTIMHADNKKSTGRMNIPYHIVSGKIKKFYNDTRISENETDVSGWKQTRVIDGITFMRLNDKIPLDIKPEFVYTLGIEDDHSYSVGGIVAENCFLLAMKDDSIRGIYDTLQDCALISQYGGGIGLHLSNIRATGSLIKGTGGISNGIVPMLRVFNNTARYVDQCFAPDTLVYTEQGPKRIEDIVAGDKVLTSGTIETVDEFGKHYNGSNGVKHCAVERLVKHNYTGLIFDVYVGEVCVSVTPAHPILAVNLTKSEDIDYYPVGELCVGDKIATPINGNISFTKIDRIVERAFTGALYDLEVNDIHDYYVQGFGFVHNGGGKRNGSFAMYLEPWHADVEDFLMMKRNTGSEEERARDLFYALWLPDLFMERVDAGGDWTLFCPNEAPGLADVVGAEFKALYERYEAEGRGRKTVKAQKLWFTILESQIETGTPYLLYKDAANLKSNQQNLGVIKSSNLCTEILEYSSKDETAVCNLASMSLPAFVRGGEFDFKHFRSVVRVVIKNLNRVIDINFYPIPEAERSNKRHRPVGLGVQGLADVFAMLGLAWESPEAALLNKRIFAHMYYAAVESSCDLAAAEGRYETFVGSPAWKGKLQPDLWNINPIQDEGLDWDGLINTVRRIGMRNSLLIAPMPTASTSQILGNCECIEPYATHIFTRRTLAGEFIVLNKHLVKALLARGLWTTEMKDAIIRNNGSVTGVDGVPEDIQNVFKTVWEIKQKVLIDMAADRGPYICQSQSLNLFLGDPDFRKLSSMHFYTWRKGLKTGIYYLRTRAVASAQKFTVEPAAATVTEGTPAIKEEKECLMCSS